jgi:hypothetical protein
MLQTDDLLYDASLATELKRLKKGVNRPGYGKNIKKRSIINNLKSN